MESAAPDAGRDWVLAELERSVDAYGQSIVDGAVEAAVEVSATDPVVARLFGFWAGAAARGVPFGGRIKVDIGRWRLSVRPARPSDNEWWSDHINLSPASNQSWLCVAPAGLTEDQAECYRLLRVASPKIPKPLSPTDAETVARAAFADDTVTSS